MCELAVIHEFVVETSTLCKDGSGPYIAHVCHRCGVSTNLPLKQAVQLTQHTDII